MIFSYNGLTLPVLLIMDGHGTHMSIELIELARSSGIHLLCLPSHMTHILKSLDIGVLKSAIFQRLVGIIWLLILEE